MEDGKKAKYYLYPQTKKNIFIKQNLNFISYKGIKHIEKELEIIDEVIKQIHASLLSSKYEKAVIVSDHGASRLAVLHETENLWQMETKGIHSGRCCPQNEINVKPHCAIETVSSKYISHQSEADFMTQ